MIIFRLKKHLRALFNSGAVFFLGEGEGEIDGVGVTESELKLIVEVCEGYYLVLRNIKFMEEISDHRTYEQAAVKLKPEKNTGLNGIRTYDLCDAGGELFQLSLQLGARCFN